MRVLIEDPSACGIGEGEKCCAFLFGAPEAFECARANEGMMLMIQRRLWEGTMTARYEPSEDVPFPTCQKERPR